MRSARDELSGAFFVSVVEMVDEAGIGYVQVVRKAWTSELLAELHGSLELLHGIPVAAARAATAHTITLGLR